VATFFTFLPSFLFILIGGPFIETTHGQLKFTAPLTAITAAVVGVIANLAVFFAWHVWWPQATAAQPLSGGFDIASALLTIAASVAIIRYKAGVIPVIAACGVAGVLVRLAFGG
jgi:chromate transporter